MKIHTFFLLILLFPALLSAQEYKLGVTGLAGIQSFEVSVEHYSVEYGLAYYPAFDERPQMAAFTFNPRWYSDNIGVGPSIAVNNLGFELGLEYVLRLKPIELNLGASMDQRSDNALRAFARIAIFVGERTTNTCGNQMNPFR